MTRFIYVLSVLSFLGAAGCADMPEGPDPAGISASFVDSNTLGRGEVHMRVSVLDAYFTPFVDMDTARLYVRQWQAEGKSKLTIIEPGSDPTASCSYFRPSSGPAAITFVVDRSLLGGDEVSRHLIRGAVEALDTSLVDARFSVINVGESVSLDQTFSSDTSLVEGALRARTVEPGALALLKGIDDAITYTAESVDMAWTRGAVVVLTGSLDTISGPGFSYDGVSARASALGVPVFIIGYGSGGFPKPEEEDLGGLWTISEASGGRYIPGVAPVYAEHIIPAVVESVGRSYEACVEAMVLPDGSDYAGTADILRMKVDVEAGGGELSTERSF